MNSPIVQTALSSLSELFSSFVNVRDYGAKGDGISDDAEAIQNAINSALSGGCQCVYFPPGNYRLNAFADSSLGGYRSHLLIGADTGAPQSLSLVGNGATILSNRKESGVNTCVIMFRNMSNSGVTRLNFLSEVYTADSAGFSLNSRLDGVFYLAPADTNASNFSVSHCSFSDFSHSVHVAGNSASSDSLSLRGLRIMNNQFNHPQGQDSAGQTAIRIGTPDIGDAIIADNFFDGCNSGICGSVGRPKDGFLISHGIRHTITGNHIHRYSYESIALFQGVSGAPHPFGRRNSDLVGGNALSNPPAANDTTGAGGYGIVTLRPNTVISGNILTEATRGIYTYILGAEGYATTTSSFVMPSSGGSVTVSTDGNSALVLGETVTIGYDSFILTAKPTIASVTLLNTGDFGNSDTGKIIPSGSQIKQTGLEAYNLQITDNRISMRGGAFGQLRGISVTEADGAVIKDNIISFDEGIDDLDEDFACGIMIQLVRSCVISGNAVKCLSRPPVGPVWGLNFWSSGPRIVTVSGNVLENLSVGIRGIDSSARNANLRDNFFHNCVQRIDGASGALNRHQEILFRPTDTGWYRISAADLPSVNGRLGIYCQGDDGSSLLSHSFATDAVIEFNGNAQDASSLLHSLKLIRWQATRGGVVTQVRIVKDVNAYLEIYISQVSQTDPVIITADAEQIGFSLIDPVVSAGGDILASMMFSDSILPATKEIDEFIIPLAGTQAASAADGAFWLLTPASSPAGMPVPYPARFAYVKEIQLMIPFTTAPATNSFSFNLSYRKVDGVDNTNSSAPGAMSDVALTSVNTAGNTYRMSYSTSFLLPPAWKSDAEAAGFYATAGIQLKNYSGASLTLRSQSIYGYIKVGSVP